MALADVFHHRAVHVPHVDVAAFLNSRWEEAKARYAAWRVYRRNLAELQSLSDRELHDLGLGRSDIRAVAKGVFHDCR